LYETRRSVEREVKGGRCSSAEPIAVPALRDATDAEERATPSRIEEFRFVLEGEPQDGNARGIRGRDPW
jgi:hypothetical protein